jgi:hypothetical protein
MWVDRDKPLNKLIIMGGEERTEGIEVGTEAT